nr:hypothetical protein [Solirubrobacteraceae bacterium]
LGPVAGSHIQGIALALAAAAPIYGGLKTARNAHGEADALAEHGWARQGIRVKSPVAQARALGLALALFGVFCVFLGLVLAVG